MALQRQEDIFTETFDDLLREYLTTVDVQTKESLRNKIVGHCMPFVQKIARGLARRGTDPVDDLIQVGCLGLIKALERFNPLLGNRFKTYAACLITGEIRHYLRDKTFIIRAPRQVYELYYRMNQIVQQLTEELGRTPTDAEIAENLECSVNQVHDLNGIDRRRNLLSLDHYLTNYDSPQGEAVYVERLVDDKYHEFLSNQEMKLVLDRAMEKLNPDQRLVVQMTYYEDMNQLEIAEALGISQMQVSRRLKKALAILSNALRSEQLDAV